MRRGALLSIGLLAFLASCPGTTDDQPSFTYSSGVTAEYGMAQNAVSSAPTWTNPPTGTVTYSIKGPTDGSKLNIEPTVRTNGVVTVPKTAHAATEDWTVTATVGDSAYTAKITITVTAKDINTVTGFSISVDDQNVPPESTFPVTINNAGLNAGTDYGLSIEKKDGAAVEAVTIDNNGRVSISSTIDTGDTGTYTVKAAGKTNYTGETTVDFVLTVVYSIGDTGPAGGTIFYVNTDPAIVDWTYLEAASQDHDVTVPWGAAGTVNTGTAIGTGESNTAMIVTALGDNGETAYAAKICNDLVLDGYDDWFLPSKDELNELYKQKDSVGGFASDFYWSSSETSVVSAWLQSFDDGAQYNGSVDYDRRVRAVRAF